MLYVFDTEEDAKKFALEKGNPESTFAIRYVDDDNWGVKGFVIVLWK